MIGRSAAAVSRPAPRTWELGAEPVLELHERERSSRRSTQVDLERLSRARSSPSTASSARARPRSPRRSSGSAALDDGELRIAGEPDARRRAGEARSPTASASCRPTGSARRSSPCARSPRTSPRRPGGGSRTSSFMITRSRRGHAPTGAGTTSCRSARATTRCSRSARSRAATSRRSCSARWLERGSPLLVMVEPTRGVDVGARAELYKSMRALAAEGIGDAHLDVGLRGGRAGRRPRARDGARQHRRRARRRRDHDESTSHRGGGLDAMTEFQQAAAAAAIDRRVPEALRSRSWPVFRSRRR